MIKFDFSATGKSLKSGLTWLSLKDASTARSICSAITSGIISLTVFSFSMVMILLNQAASQMSNRVLDKLIGNRFQQVVLGFYIGTIVYALFLLSTIRDIDTGISIPAISTYLLITLTIIDIFLFIYFLHFVTQSVKYDTIINKVHHSTRDCLESVCVISENTDADFSQPASGISVPVRKSGLYQGFDQERLIKLCKSEDVMITMLHPPATFLLAGSSVIMVTGSKALSSNFEDALSQLINVDTTQDITTNYYYGFRQLMEVAIKALSPGINDPGTAVMSLRAIMDLLAFRMQHFPRCQFEDEFGQLRIIAHEKTATQIFKETVLPIWDYGCKDRMVQQEFIHLLTQLKKLSDVPALNSLMSDVHKAIEEKT
ncbi:DUF2254 domain-containing protein [Segetibacter sp. 3557_3]|uniref:DUF2254 domain-containing protein n=1 Tax=Segetibacter sp. 3557_3 TaxID=2547429 RepID=UPI001FB650E8|nr:DUF2254 domain-containing protein [Segetibacter sp. 3557_3]